MNLDYYKKFLWPPQELLDSIRFTENGHWGITVIPYRESNDGGSFYALSEVVKIRESWVMNYLHIHELNSKQRDGFEKENRSQGFTQRSLVSLSEMIKNTFEHGNKNRVEAISHFGYWFTENGLVAGIRDEGNFYSQLETKEKIEKKVRIPTSKDGPGGSGISRCLYTYSDNLRVRLEQNALFASFEFKSILNDGEL